MKLKRNLLLIFFILAGIVLGGMLANLCANIPFLSWLAYSSSIGFNADSPFVLDLSVIKLTFGFSMGISVAQIITIALLQQNEPALSCGPALLRKEGT